LKRADWADVIVNHNGAAAADLLDLPMRHHDYLPFSAIAPPTKETH